jgi:protein O-GlcNAc transferase
VLVLLSKLVSDKDCLSSHLLHKNISRNRLHLSGELSTSLHFRRIASCDILIDTFYYNVITSAVSALWAGVPTITYPTLTNGGRSCAAAMLTAGCPEVVARTVEDFVDIAAVLLNNPARLSAIRSKVAEVSRFSDLFNPGKWIQNWESGLRSIYEEFINHIDSFHHVVTLM